VRTPCTVTNLSCTELMCNISARNILDYAVFQTRIFIVQKRRWRNVLRLPLQVRTCLPCLHLAQITTMLCKQHAAKHVCIQKACFCHLLKLERDINDQPFLMCVPVLPCLHSVWFGSQCGYWLSHVNARWFLCIGYAS
jgi:hypothetical protein